MSTWSDLVDFILVCILVSWLIWFGRRMRWW